MEFPFWASYQSIGRWAAVDADIQSNERVEAAEALDNFSSGNWVRNNFFDI